jgi:predicted dehydrogenase
MKKLRVGLIGAGLVGQAEHAFYLWEERERFSFAALADASPSVRAKVAARYGVAEVHAGMKELLTSRLDAVVIAAPDAFHPELAIAALESGVHVLCEKPLALTEEDCDRIIAARDRTGAIAQVAYMKRYDPAFRQACEYLPKDAAEIKLISVEVNDPDQHPFVAHLPMHAANDIPSALRIESQDKTASQLRRAAGRELDETGARALGGGFLSSLVHDVAVVRGLLRRIGHDLGAEADFGAYFDAGRGVQLGLGLPWGGRVSMTHLNLPGVPDYTERITVFCTDRIIELVFPSPYLRHLPTRLTVRRSAGGYSLETVEFRASYEEAFRDELRAFHSAVTEAKAVETPLEEGRRDVQLLISAFRRAAA